CSSAATRGRTGSGKASRAARRVEHGGSADSICSAALEVRRAISAASRGSRMSDTRGDIPSVVERTRPVTVDAPVVDVRFLGDTAAFVLGEEALVLLARNGEERRVAVHAGVVLSAAADDERIVTGGDDGKVVATDASGATTAIAADAKRRWIDQVAGGPDGALAWAAGKSAVVRS